MAREAMWICIRCSKFVSYKDFDIGTMYGTKDYDYPEPLDPDVWCGKCAKEEYKEALKAGVNMSNYWEKPKWQMKAMKKLGLIEKDFRLVFNKEGKVKL